jgi:hypothetical protein
MTNNRSTTHRQIRFMQVIFAGAATVASLALFSAARPGDAASGPVSLATPSTQGSGFAADGPWDDNGQAGDIFTQNAQDQSTA